jgi:histidinol-phosphatase (PHP family)
MCERAVDKGLRALAITDHCEIDKFFEQRYSSSVFHSYFETVKARSAFEGQLLVLIGLEIAQVSHNIYLSEKIVEKYPFDYILGSVHTPRGFNEDIKEIDYTKLDVYKFMNNYFDELTELAAWKGCDALAHITCPMRRIQGYYKIDFDYNKVSESLDRLLMAIIKNNKALEINTSGLRQDIGKFMPEEIIVRRFRELGGKYVTIGSDAHNIDDIGAGIEDAMVMVKNCGFDKITFYVSRQAIQIGI